MHRSLYHVPSEARSYWYAITSNVLLPRLDRAIDLRQGESKTFVGGEHYLKQRGIEVVVLQNDECQKLMEKFTAEHPNDWLVMSESPLGLFNIYMADRLQERGYRRRVQLIERVILLQSDSKGHELVYLCSSSKKNFRSSGFTNGVIPTTGQRARRKTGQQSYRARG